MESCTGFSQGPLSTMEHSKDPPKDNKILIGSEKPPHTSFFCFRKNFFFWRQAHFFPTFEVPPPPNVLAVSLGPDDSH